MGSDIQPQVQEAGHLFAQIQPHSGGIAGLVPGAAVAAGETPVKNPRQLVVWDTDAVVRDG